MKIMTFVRKTCEKCRFIRRRRRIIVICSDLRHKQRKGNLSKGKKGPCKKKESILT